MWSIVLWLRIHTLQGLLRSFPQLDVPGSLQLQHLQVFDVDNSDNLDEVKAMLSAQLEFQSLRHERQHMKEAVQSIIQRAGRLVATGVAALAFRRLSATRLTPQC